MSARKGIVETCRDVNGRPYYRGRVKLADGTWGRITLEDPQLHSKTGAADAVAAAQEIEDETHALLNAKLAKAAAKLAKVEGPPGESCDDWYRRFMVCRRSEVGSVEDDRRRWEKWISPHIGSTPMIKVTADDVENVRDALTAAVVAYEAGGNVKADGRLAPKTAQNIWTALTTAMKYASTRKGPRELRVREAQGNPCAGIEPPRDGESKQRHWCRPGEILAVVSCAQVPRAWREAIAIGSYLHLRPGELHELRIKDLDLEAGEVKISRAYDERKKVVKSPKTRQGIRHVTVPPALLPLLQRLADDGQAEDRVAPIVAATEEYFRAGLFRSYLEAAGVRRAELFVETATHIKIDFRSLRDSGITWRFLAGERVEVVQREAGHEQITTTLGYAHEVSARGGRFGEPFPELPEELSTGESPPDSEGGSIHLPIHLLAKSAKEQWAQRDLNPRPTD